MAIILLFKTADETIEFPLLGKTVIGRSSSCDLTINDKQMSGKHGTFEVNPQGKLLFTDLGSTNGSYLNNNQIQKIEFRVSDVLKMGNTTVSIDESKLTSKERIAIGKGNAIDKSQLSVTPMSTSHSIVPAKKGVSLNKNLKTKIHKKPDEWAGNKGENLIEQEESTGKTKMLKLDLGKGDGKKK